MTIIDAIKDGLGLSRKDAPTVEPPVSEQEKPKPRSRNALKLVELAMGHTLRVGRDAAAFRASRNISPGRLDRVYIDGYSADCDYSLARAEERRDTLASQIAAARARIDATSLLAEAPDAGLLARLENEYREVDEKIAVIIAYGAPLARRAMLNDALFDAEAERVEALARHAKMLPGLAAASAPLPDDWMPARGELAAKRAHVQSERDLRAAVDACERNVSSARYHLEQWAMRFPAIAASLENE